MNMWRDCDINVGSRCRCTLGLLTDPMVKTVPVALIVGSLLLVPLNDASAQQSKEGTARSLVRRPFSGMLFRAVDNPEIRGFLPRDRKGNSDLQIGDKVLKINDTPIASVSELMDVLHPLRVGDEVVLQIQRGEEQRAIKIRLPEWPREEPTGFEVLYDEVKTETKALRCLVTCPPDAAHGRVPAIFYIQGIDGATVESPFPGPSHMRDFVYALSRAGFAVMRCEKSGVGDSTGPDCTQLGLGEEVADFTAALHKLKSYDFVDKDKVFLFGHSAGGWVAPLVAAKEPVRGIAVYGTVVRPFGEYLVENHRRNKWHRSRPDPAELELEVRRMSRLWDLLLNQRQSPAEVLKSHPDLRDVATHVFRGRADLPYDVRSLAYFRDVHQQNMPAIWGKLRVPVLAMVGQYEVRCSQFEHEYIADIVNFHAPGQGAWKVLPRLDHGFAEHHSMQDAVDNEFHGPFGNQVVSESVEWMRGVLRGPSASK